MQVALKQLRAGSDRAKLDARGRSAEKFVFSWASLFIFHQSICFCRLNFLSIIRLRCFHGHRHIMPSLTTSVAILLTVSVAISLEPLVETFFFCMISDAATYSCADGAHSHSHIQM